MIEVVALGTGATPDLATFEALREAVRNSAAISVESRTWTYDKTHLDYTILTRSAGYIQAYTIRELKQENGRYVVRVLAKVKEQELKRDLLSGVSQGAAFDGALWAARKSEENARRALVDEQSAMTNYMAQQFTTSEAFRRTFPIRVDSLDNGDVVFTAVLPEWRGWLSRKYGDAKYPATIEFRDASGTLIAEQGRMVGWSSSLVKDGIQFRTHWDELPVEQMARVRRIEVVWR